MVVLYQSVTDGTCKPNVDSIWYGYVDLAEYHADSLYWDTWLLEEGPFDEFPAETDEEDEDSDMSLQFFIMSKVVEYLLRDVKDTTISTLATEVTGKLAALKGLDARLKEIRGYLDLVIDRKLPLNHEILYHLQLPPLRLPFQMPVEDGGGGGVAEIIGKKDMF
ncbi:26S proteasome non-ATPase regulatory subunit 7 homolog A-like protein [Tanacetum coccineum]